MELDRLIREKDIMIILKEYVRFKLLEIRLGTYSNKNYIYRVSAWYITCDNIKYKIYLKSDFSLAIFRRDDDYLYYKYLR